MSATEKIKNIYLLKDALDRCGIHAEIDFNAEWYCTDNKTHYGIELYTDYEEDYSFIFTPDGTLIHSCLEAPLLRK